MPVPPSPAVLRACDVLDHLAHQPRGRLLGLGGGAIGRRAARQLRLGAPGPRERGLVQRDVERRYSLGPACRTLGEAARVRGRAAHGPGAGRPTTSRAAPRRAWRSPRARGARPASSGCSTAVPAFGLRARVGESVPLTAPFGAVFVASGRRRRDRRAGSTAPVRRSAPPNAPTPSPRWRRRASGGYTVAVAGAHPDLVRMLEDLADHAPAAADLDVREPALIREVSPREYLPVAVATDGPQARQPHVGARLRHGGRRCRTPAHGARPEPRAEPRTRSRSWAAACATPPERPPSGSEVGPVSPDATKPLPVPDERSAGYWAAAAAGTLALPRCTVCGRYALPPGPRLPVLREHRPRVRRPSRSRAAAPSARGRWSATRSSPASPTTCRTCSSTSSSTPSPTSRLIGRLVDGADAPLAPRRPRHRDLRRARRRRRGPRVRAGRTT